MGVEKFIEFCRRLGGEPRRLRGVLRTIYSCILPSTSQVSLLIDNPMILGDIEGRTIKIPVEDKVELIVDISPIIETIELDTRDEHLDIVTVRGEIIAIEPIAEKVKRIMILDQKGYNKLIETNKLIEEKL